MMLPQITNLPVTFKHYCMNSVVRPVSSVTAKSIMKLKAKSRFVNQVWFASGVCQWHLEDFEAQKFT